MFIVISGRKRIFQPVFGVLVFVLIVQIIPFLDLVVLVVPGIQNNGRIVLESLNILPCSVLYGLTQ